MLVSTRLKDLRVARGITQEELASQLGISQSAITAYENGVRTPKLELLKVFARFYGVDMNHITGFTPE